MPENPTNTPHQGLIISHMRTELGRDVVVYYDPETTMTLIYNYIPGRSVIFEGRLVDDFSPESGTNPLVGCYVENHILEEMSGEFQLFSSLKSTLPQGNKAE